MTFPRLRAKSGPGDFDSEFLPGHLNDVYRAAEQVIAATVTDQLAALSLSADLFSDRLRRIVLLSAAVHDLGKANDHFQAMIYRLRNIAENPQGLRHEWATLLILRQLRDWLLPAVAGSEIDYSIVEWAVAGHHPSPNHASPPIGAPDGAGPDMTLLMGHDDFRAALEFLKSTFDLGNVPVCAEQMRSLIGAESVFQEIAKWSKDSRRMWDRMRGSPDGRLVAAVKNSLIAGDVAGSALPRVFHDAAKESDWIRESFASKPEPGDLALIVAHRLNGQIPREFQGRMAAAKGRIAFVKAGCGTGKTLGAYMRAAEKHPTRRLYFCYPTTGTATEGFRDYLFDESARVPKVGARLFHSRAQVDFEIILDVAGDAPAFDGAFRLDAIEMWSTPVVSCTVDTVLGVVQNNKRGLFAWPALSQGAFVFDEIHAYDDRLFGALLRFLRDIPGVPVLLMTASLPKAREMALREVFEAKGIDWEPIAGPSDLETMPRYHREPLADNGPLPAIERTLAGGGKVLWVCNTVARVMEAAERASKYAPAIYHSRFKYEDRVARHSEVIERFRSDGAAIAICSQVAEMSLDLSADLLVTDLATVPAMIQRLGRLNRRAKSGDTTRPFVVVEPGTALPYMEDDLEGSREWLVRLPSDVISQANLIAVWEQSSDPEPVAISSAWLDGGPVTNVVELRELSPGITVVMAEDLGRIRANPRELPRLTLPMPVPRGFQWTQWPREKGLPIAPSGSIQYDHLRGAEWQKG